ncbi:MAG: hypothetical protein IJ309_02085 [Clostridia bacterium]|nr:hypothetical protein [Clostridia bacterium]
MKTKILAVLLAVCLCVPFVFASCSDGTATVSPMDFLASDASVRPEQGPVFDAHLSMKTEGEFTLVNGHYFVEKVTRDEDVTVTPEGGTEYTYTKHYTDYNIYKTADQTKVATYTARTDLGYTDEERDDDEVVYVNIFFQTLSLKGDGYLVVKTRTYDDTYATKMINDKNEAILSYEGDTDESVLFNGISAYPTMTVRTTFHATLDNVLYRFELDGKEATVVKDLDLTRVDNALSEDIGYGDINLSYYADGKYVFVYDEYVVIYNDKLEAPKTVEFPLDEKVTDQPHNETEVAIDGVYKLNNGNLYMLYTESKVLDCNDCENSCNLFTEEKDNYLWLDGTTGYNYKAFIVDVQSASVNEVKAPSVLITTIAANPNAMIEMYTGSRIYKEDIENAVSGYEIVDQSVDESENVMCVMDNKGNITATAKYPANVSNVYPIGEGQYVATIGGVGYIVDKDYNIVSEILSGSNGTTNTTIIGDAVYNMLTGEKVFDIPEEYNFEGATSGLYIFLKSEEVENEGVTETKYTIMLVDENGETYKSIEKDDYTSIQRYSSDYLVIRKEIVIEDELIGEYTDYYQYIIYNANGKHVATIDADQYNTPSFSSYEDMLIVRYIEDLKEGEAESKTVLLTIFEAPTSQGE